MNIIFLGSLFPPNLRQEIEANSKGNIQYASNTLQWNFIRGLDAENSSSVRIINAPIIGSFPSFYKKLFLKHAIFSHAENSIDVSIGYCNFAIIKNHFIKKSLLKELSKCIKENGNESKIIIVYGMLAPWVLAAIKIKKSHPDIKLCLIVPDLPEYMNNSNSFAYKIREFLNPNLYKYIHLFDSFVFLTKQMADFIQVGSKPYVIIEGMINHNDTIISSAKKTYQNKIILYTGTIADRYGILDLLDAFSMIKQSNYELWICGNGNTKNIIIQKAIKDSRIKYFGQLPREKILELQKQATVLINPRNSKGEFTKYSFPSKIMEYLLSGTPCIMYSLPGIPSEYNDFIFFINNEGPLALRDKIIEVCNMNSSDLISLGKKAQSFVLNRKNYIVQTQKLTHMLTRLNIE